jgi:hypothetical protein
MHRRRSKGTAITVLLSAASVVLLALVSVIAVSSSERAELRAEEQEFDQYRWDQSHIEPQRQVDEAQFSKEFQEFKSVPTEWELKTGSLDRL